MISLVLVAVAGAVASTILSGLILRYARRTRLLDVPNPRSSHRVPTPRGGGLAIVVVTSVALAAVAGLGRLDRDTALAIGGGLPVALVGWLDDRHGVRAGTRALVQLLCAGWTLWWLGAGEVARLSGGGLGGVLAVSLGLVGIVWLTNLYNFMDGIDGIAGGQAAVTGAVMAYALSRGGQSGLAQLAAVVAGASLGFLRWNRPPARLFMGDVGSGFLGFFFGAIAAAGARDGSVPLLAWLPPFAVFLVDATVTLLRRIARGDPWYAAHRSHAYQRAVQAGLSHGTVSAVVVGTGLVAGTAGVLALAAGRPEALPGVAFGAMAGACGLYLLVERRLPMSRPSETAGAHSGLEP
jgi:Fuc2NAc and GlcNAc transferase